MLDCGRKPRGIKSMDKFAEEKLEEFKKHQSQLELHGVDNLTIEEAYMRVLGTCSGYINGLGFGLKPPKGIKGGNFPEESSLLAHQMDEQFDHLERAARNREDQLNEQIQGLQRDEVTMLEEIEKMKKDVEEREQRMRERRENEVRLPRNDETTTLISRINTIEPSKMRWFRH